MEKVKFVEFRKHLSEYVGRSRFAKERIAVTYHGKIVGGFVSAEALKFLEDLETRNDIEAFDRGMDSIKKSGTMSLEEFRKEIGIE